MVITINSMILKSTCFIHKTKKLTLCFSCLCIIVFFFQELILEVHCFISSGTGAGLGGAGAFPGGAGGLYPGVGGKDAFSFEIP